MALSFRSKASESSAYRADIDGLRAIAVLSVMLFHAGVPHVTGGFVGVDIFFVISGYLITQVIDAELNAGRFTFIGFYERRVRRIFPALIVVLLATTAFGMLVFARQQLVELGKSLLAVAGFVSNLYFRSTSHATGYFADTSGERYLLHTWSLSVEEQFYLLFPGLLLLLHRFGRRAKKALIILLGVLSFWASVHAVNAQPMAAFYLLPSRAWELLLGALVAYGTFPPMRHAFARAMTGALGVALMLWGITTYTSSTPFPGLAALAPCLGAALLIYAGEGGGSLTRSVMSAPPLVFVGVISYSLYLWHWPIIAATKAYYAAYSLPWQQQVPGMLLSFVLATLSYLFVETPLRRRRDKTAPKGKAVAWGLAVNGAMALLGLLFVATHGLPQRFNERKSTALAQNFDRKSEIAQAENCNNSREKDIAHVYFCNPVPGTRNILFWGDSHTMQIFPLLNRMAAAGDFGGRGVVYAISAGCTFGPDLNLTSPGIRCDVIGKLALQRALQDDIDTVFVTFSPWWQFAPVACIQHESDCVAVPGDVAWKTYVTGMERDIRTLQAAGKHVILTVPFPIYATLIPDLMMRNIALGHFRSQQGLARELPFILQRADTFALAARTSATLYDPRALLCPAEQCIYQESGVSLYSDQSHLATSQIERFRPGIRSAVEASWQQPVPHSGSPAPSIMRAATSSPSPIATNSFPGIR